MPVDRWYITGLLIALLLVSLGILYVRWSTLQQRVPLIAGNMVDIEHIDQKTIEKVDTSPAVEPVQNRQTNPVDSRDNGSPKVDLNTADRAALEGLPGIGPVLAGRIIEYRDRYGPFRRVDDLLGVEGIGPSKLQDIRGLVDVQSGQ